MHKEVLVQLHTQLFLVQVKALLILLLAEWYIWEIAWNCVSGAFCSASIHQESHLGLQLLISSRQYGLFLAVHNSVQALYKIKMIVMDHRKISQCL